MTSAEINAEWVCPLRTPNLPPGMRDYDPKTRPHRRCKWMCDLWTSSTSIGMHKGHMMQSTLMAPKWSLAMNYYQPMGPVHHDVVVYSGSMSCLQTVEGEDTENPYHESLVVEWQRHTCSFLLDTKPLWKWRKWKSGPISKWDPRPR